MFENPNNLPTESLDADVLAGLAELPETERAARIEELKRKGFLKGDVKIEKQPGGSVHITGGTFENMSFD
jgi:hypothetical protein